MESEELRVVMEELKSEYSWYAVFYREKSNSKNLMRKVIYAVSEESARIRFYRQHGTKDLVIVRAEKLI
jgi:hypothetical protein